MPLWHRCHVPLCVAFESISVTAVKRGGGAPWREAMVLARGVKASYKLIKALGHELYPNTKRRIADSPEFAVAAILWGLSRIPSFRQLLATGQAECVALVDDMVTAAAEVRSSVAIADILAMKP